MPFADMEETCLGLVRAEVPLRQPGREATEAIGSPDLEVRKRCSLEIQIWKSPARSWCALWVHEITCGDYSEERGTQL